MRNRIVDLSRGIRSPPSSGLTHQSILNRPSTMTGVFFVAILCTMALCAAFIPHKDVRILSTTLTAVSRRQILSTAPLVLPFLLPPPSHAITTDEFRIILQESARSIDRVEFAGPQSTQVSVVLRDDTRFAVTDAVESSTDPRSPLLIAALCRDYNVPTKFVDLQSVLQNVKTTRKNYANVRVQEAAARQAEKEARIVQDEQERLRVLSNMKEQNE